MKKLKNILYDLQGACILLKTASDNTTNPASPLYCTMLARKIYETANNCLYVCQQLKSLIEKDDNPRTDLKRQKDEGS